MSYTVAGVEKILLDGKLPEKWQTQFSPPKFVDQPGREGRKSFTFGAFSQTEGVFNTHFNLNNWLPIISFEGVRLTDDAGKNLAQYQETSRKAARLISDTPEGFSFLRRAIDLIEGDDKQRAAKALVEIKDFMKQSGGSVNAYEALKLAYDYFSRAGDGDPMAKIGDFIRETKSPVAATRAFYADRAPGWMNWHVFGPISALGERRGMETTLAPERGVDLVYTTQSNGRDIVWKKDFGEEQEQRSDDRLARAIGRGERIAERAVLWLRVHEIQFAGQAQSAVGVRRGRGYFNLGQREACGQRTVFLGAERQGECGSATAQRGE